MTMICLHIEPFSYHGEIDSVLDQARNKAAGFLDRFCTAEYRVQLGVADCRVEYNNAEYRVH